RTKSGMPIGIPLSLPLFIATLYCHSIAPLAVAMGRFMLWRTHHQHGLIISAFIDGVFFGDKEHRR
ncbi:MAG: hypothetical protein ACRC9M_01140, partial [Aeromonas sp.]